MHKNLEELKQTINKRKSIEKKGYYLKTDNEVNYKKGVIDMLDMFDKVCIMEECS